MTIKRFLQRVTFYPAKFFVELMEYFTPPYYVKYYSKLLKHYGMNLTTPVTYIHHSANFDDFNRITIGKGVVISKNVYFLTHDFSPYCAFKACGWKHKKAIPVLGDIKVGENVFIGAYALIMPNTTIGDNCIIGAGSVVKGKIPDNSVLIGNPAKVICPVEKIAEKYKYLFNEAVADKCDGQ